VRIAHIKERHAPAGSPWRLAVARGNAWLDLETARRRAIRSEPSLAHNDPLYRQPITTLDDHLARGLRIDHLRPLVESFAPFDGDDDALLESADVRFGPPVLRPPSFRDFYAFERHVRTVWARRDQDVPDAWHRLAIFYFSNTSEIRGPDEPVWAPNGSLELDFELEVGAVVDTPGIDLVAGRGEAAIGGYTILNDWSARDLQRDETTVRLGPAKGKDFATSIGPWLVTPDELADARDAKGYDLAMTARVRTGGTAGASVDVSAGRWCDAAFSFGEMLERASADVHVRPGDLLGSGTVGTGCLLESKDATLGRWLEPGDEVVLSIERLGELRSPVIERPNG
jgi:fumarylacetoacetate (FAA) hydrolase